MGMANSGVVVVGAADWCRVAALEKGSCLADVAVSLGGTKVARSELRSAIVNLVVMQRGERGCRMMSSPRDGDKDPRCLSMCPGAALAIQNVMRGLPPRVASSMRSQAAEKCWTVILNWADVWGSLF